MGLSDAYFLAGTAVLMRVASARRIPSGQSSQPIIASSSGCDYGSEEERERVARQRERERERESRKRRESERENRSA